MKAIQSFVDSILIIGFVSGVKVRTSALRQVKSVSDCWVGNGTDLRYFHLFN